MRISFTLNGTPRDLDVEPRRLLADVLRHQLGCYGVHLGCEHGVCGACTVLIDGATALSCLTLAVMADGADVVTVEGLREGDGLHPVQTAFNTEHGLQCGFCTPGFVVAAADLLRRIPDPDEPTIRSELSGNICRCTGYVNIVKAVQRAAAGLSAAPAGPGGEAPE